MNDNHPSSAGLAVSGAGVLHSGALAGQRGREVQPRGLLQRARIVIGHPDDFVRAFWCQLVEVWGMKVVGSVASGAEATDAARATKPGLVLLDSGLKGLPALEVARLVVASLNADVVLVTASSSTPTEHGPRIQLLSAPVSPWDLRHALFQRVWAAPWAAETAESPRI